MKRETDPNDPKADYLVADDTIDSAEDGDIVGVYELKETRTVHVSRELK